MTPPRRPQPDDVAEHAYAAYSAAVGGRSVRGEPLPPWEELGDLIQTAWTIAALTSVVYAEDGNSLLPPRRPDARTLPEVIGSEANDNGVFYVWIGALSGWKAFHLATTDATMLLHRCGHTVEIEDEYLGNAIVDHVIGHTCQ